MFNTTVHNRQTINLNRLVTIEYKFIYRRINIGGILEENKRSSSWIIKKKKREKDT